MFQKRNFLYIALLLAVIFGMGISLGLNYDTLRQSFLQQETKTFEAQVQDFVVSNELIGDLNSKNCQLVTPYLSTISKQSEELAQVLQDLENKGLTQSKDYTSLRQSYFLQEIQYWMNVEKYKKCNPDIVTILFFYDTSSDSTRQGYVLTELRKENSGKVFVFSFDAGNVDTNSVKLIQTVYNITISPSLVVNSKKVLEGFTDFDSLQNATKSN